MVNKFKLGAIQNNEAKEAISRTLAIANTYAGELSIEVIPLDKVELDPENKRDMALTLTDALNGIDKNDPLIERKKQDLKSLETLAKTIQNDQLINPIFVYRYGNKCRLIAGERRTLATAIAGKKEIMARIANQRPVGTKLRVLQWVENNERADLSLNERIASLQAIIHEYFSEENIKPNYEKITAKLLADLTGISATQARRYLLILQAGPDIKRAIEQNQLENIKLIELICSVKNVPVQRELLAAAVAGKSFETILKLKNNLEGEQSNTVKKKQNNNHINLGNIKVEALRSIVKALINHPNFEPKVLQKMKMIGETVTWHNHHSLSQAFKKISSLLENGV